QKEASMTSRSEAPADRPPEWRESLDQELEALPDKYRTVLVLCGLEGRTRKDVARQLGCPGGTVAGRVARARVLLAKRLVGRGLVLPGALLAAALSPEAASAGVPVSLVRSTVQAASLFAAGKAGAVALPVSALTEGVLNTMWLTRRKLATAVLLAAVAVGAG